MTPFERLVQLRAAYPDLMTLDQIGELLNQLVYEHKDQGMRLLGKAGGHTVPQPGTGIRISSDYLLHLPTLTGHDCLTDNGTATRPATRNGIPVGFTWGPGREDLREAIRSGARSVVEPVQPGNTGADDDDDNNNNYHDDLDPPPSTGDDGLAARVAQLDAQVAGLFALHEEVVRQIGRLNQQFVNLEDPKLNPFIREEQLTAHLPEYVGRGLFGTTVTSKPKP